MKTDKLISILAHAFVLVSLVLGVKAERTSGAKEKTSLMCRVGQHV